MVKLILRIAINAIALYVADRLVAGISVPSDFVGLLLVAVVFGLVNAFIKPIVSLLSCPLTIITLGLFTLVINALMLMLTEFLVGGLSVENFWSALMGAIIISIVSTILSWFLTDKD